MNEKEIVAFIEETEQDLKIAKAFLAMWRRRASNPIAVPGSQFDADAASDSGGGGEANGNGTHVKGEKEEYGATKKRILEAISKCPYEYTFRDVERAIAGLGYNIKKTAIQQGLSRLKSQKVISMVREAAGPNPALYVTKKN